MGKYLLIFSVFLSANLFGQDFDNLMVKKQFDCSDISYNCSLLFERYYTGNKVDSAKNIVAYWESKCGLREPVQRARILLSLKEGNFKDSLLSQGVLAYIFNYQNRMDMVKFANYYSYDNYKSYYGFIPAGQDFDKFTIKAAIELKAKYNPESIEYLICEFYGDNCDTIFAKIQSNKNTSSILSVEYKKSVDKYLNISELHMALITGVWIPTGGISKLGLHPEIGFQIGAKHKKMNYDFVVSIKFLNSPNDYYARRTKGDGSLELTNNFLGGYVGFNVGRDIFYRDRHEIQVLSGIAYDGFDALKEDKSKEIQFESVSSFNFNVGLGYRYYLNNSSYLGVSAKYNFVDYSANKVIDFRGNPISIQFIIGGLLNTDKDSGLKALKYKWRK